MAFRFHKHIVSALVIALLVGCSAEKRLDGPDFYEDGFENYTDLDELLLDDDVKWSFTQQTLSGNTITLDTSVVHSGQQSLRFSDVGTSGDVLSKCSIVKQKMAFWEGETVYFSIWYYLEGEGNADWLFLVDLEEQIQIGAGPGMRLAIVSDSALVVEHKFPNPNIMQTSGNILAFPRNQWVHLEFETRLSQKEEGYVKVWQDDELILAQDNWQTLPKDIGPFMQGTKGMFSSIEIGLTANPGANGHTLYADDFLIERR